MRLLDGALGRLGYRLNGLQLLYGIGFRQRATVDAAGDQSGLVDHIEIGRRHARVGVQEPLDTLRRAGEPHVLRSEEHTSELQSLMRISYAVFCLKKKKKTIQSTAIKITKNT